MLRKLTRGEKGFTLVELMVVILIIAVLLAIAIPVYNVAVSNARNRTCQATRRTLDGANQAYRADTEAYADDTSALVAAQYLESGKCPFGSVIFSGTVDGCYTPWSSNKSTCTVASCTSGSPPATCGNY